MHVYQLRTLGYAYRLTKDQRCTLGKLPHPGGRVSWSIDATDPAFPGRAIGQLENADVFLDTSFEELLSHVLSSLAPLDPCVPGCECR